MKKASITVVEKEIYVHDIVVLIDDDMDDAAKEEIVKKINHELGGMHSSNVDDVARLLKNHGIKIVEIERSDESLTKKSEIPDIDPRMDILMNILSRLNEDEQIALIRVFFFRQMDLLPEVFSKISEDEKLALIRLFSLRD